MDRLPHWLIGAAGGALGAVALLVVGIATRTVLRVPMVPEVLVEWGTFYVPQELFTFMVNRFGGQAKLALFWSMVLGIVLVGMALGALYTRRPTPRLAVMIGLAAWLFILLVVLPADGLGFFGMDLYPAGPLAASAAYLLGCVAYMLVLSAVYWLALRHAGGVPAPSGAARLGARASARTKEVSR